MRHVMSILLFGILPFVGIFYAYDLNKSEAILKYTLSEMVPLRFQNDSPAFVQQIEIANTGNKEASRIVIIINKKIQEYDIRKYSESDSFEVYQKSDAFELIYPSLPPSASISIVFRLPDKGIHRGEFSVTHSAGGAINALAADKSSFWVPYFVIVGLFLYMITGVTVAKGYLLDGYLWKAVSEYAFDDILKRRKPFLMQTKLWIELYALAIQTKLAQFCKKSYSIEESNAYRFLNGSLPDYLKSEKGYDLHSRARECLSRMIRHEIMCATSYLELEQLLSVAMPQYFKENDWGVLRDEIHKKYISIADYDVVSTYEIEKLCEKFKAKPKNFDESHWGKLQRVVRDRYISFVYEGLYYAHNFTSDSRCEDLLSYDEKNRLNLVRSKLYLTNSIQPLSAAKLEAFLQNEHPGWVDEKEKKDIEDFCKEFLRVFEMREFLMRIESGLDLDLSRKYISDKEWEWMRKVHSQLVSTPKANSELRDKLLAEQLEVERLKRKILKQLEFINNFLQDPTIVDKVESYDDLFSEGNLQNLKKIKSRCISNSTTTAP